MTDFEKAQWIADNRKRYKKGEMKKMLGVTSSAFNRLQKLVTSPKGHKRVPSVAVFAE